MADFRASERLARFADGLEQLAERWEREARDPRVAAALSERFGASAPGTAGHPGRGRPSAGLVVRTPGALPPKLLLRLHDALAALAVLAAYAPPLAELNIVPIIDVKSRAQAVRLETATRKLLKGLGRVLAAGAVGASGAERPAGPPRPTTSSTPTASASATAGPIPPRAATATTAIRAARSARRSAGPTPRPADRP